MSARVVVHCRTQYSTEQFWLFSFLTSIQSSQLRCCLLDSRKRLSNGLPAFSSSTTFSGSDQWIAWLRVSVLNMESRRHFCHDADGDCRLRPGTATWRTRRNIRVVSDSAHLLCYVKTWRHPQNRNYITYYIAVRGEASHGQFMCNTHNVISPQNLVAEKNIIFKYTLFKWKRNMYRQELIRRWDSKRELFTTIWHQKSRVPELSYGEKKIAEKFNRLSRVHQRHRRQTTDGIAIAISKRNVIRSRLLTRTHHRKLSLC